MRVNTNSRTISPTDDMALVNGLVAQNLVSSKSGAEAAASNPIDGGIEASRLIAIDYGESRPMADNDRRRGKPKIGGLNCGSGDN